MFECNSNLIPSKILCGDKRLIKIIIPENEIDYVNGEGEVCFAYILNPSNLEKHQCGIGYYSVVLLQDSEYFKGILNRGCVVEVDGNGKNRPIMDYDWFLQGIETRVEGDIYGREVYLH